MDRRRSRLNLTMQGDEWRLTHVGNGAPMFCYGAVWTEVAGRIGGLARAILDARPADSAPQRQLPHEF